MARMIYKCKNKTCKTIRTIEYPEVQVFNRGYGRIEREYYRIANDGSRKRMGYESLCQCGFHATGNRVKGFVTAHECDARCTSATGHICECSCGGKNHGIAHAA